MSDLALGDFPDVLAQDFNHMTCEYQRKIAKIHPAEDTYAWDAADRVADFARQHNMKLTGHTLLWYQEAPDWMFVGVTAGDAASLELLKSRLKAHIEAVIGRYADVVDNWDVVNEALSDDTTKQYRDGSEGSKWYELFGSEEYIYWAYRAYKFAKDALEAKSPGSSAGKLYYNEYTATLKADKMLKMLAWLKDEKGLPLDGVGFQSHENMTWPSTSDIQLAIDKLKTAGYKIKISELDGKSNPRASLICAEIPRQYAGLCRLSAPPACCASRREASLLDGHSSLRSSIRSAPSGRQKSRTLHARASMFTITSSPASIKTN